MYGLHKTTMMVGLALSVGLLSCAQNPNEPTPFDGNVWSTSGAVDHFNPFMPSRSVSDSAYDLTEIEDEQ